MTESRLPENPAKTMKTEAKMHLFQGDVFSNQKVPIGDCRRWSRHFVAELRCPAKVSPIYTVEPTTEKTIRAREYTNVVIHSTQMDLVKPKPKMALRREVMPIDQRLREAREAEIALEGIALEDMCTPLSPVKESPLQELNQTWQSVIQSEGQDDFEDIAVLAEEMTEEPREDKSVRRRFLNWLNEMVEYYHMKKVARTYLRELEEGNQIFRPSVSYRLISRAQRERDKRERLIYRDGYRQRLKEMLDSYWANHHKEKELLILKEEERYEKWAAEHDLSVPDSAAGQPKKRMSKWEKRFLRAKGLFH